MSGLQETLGWARPCAASVMIGKNNLSTPNPTFPFSLSVRLYLSLEPGIQNNQRSDDQSN